MRRDILAKDVANREHLYSEFLKEVGNLYFDSVNRTLDDTSQQASPITMYMKVGTTTASAISHGLKTRGLADSKGVDTAGVLAFMTLG